MWPFSRPAVVPVLRLYGPIGMAAPLRPGLSLATIAGPLERTFRMSRLPSVALMVNSPGGSPVQSNLIFRRIRQLAAEHEKRVYVFCEDVAASGGYFIAAAGDEIYADPSSIVGSIGVISAGFGFEKAIEKLGVERRVYTSGLNKSQLDPFRPENPEDIERLKAIQQEIHQSFIAVVKESRGRKLKGADADLFSGAFWAAGTAVDLGLVDGLSDVRTKMREVHGDKVKLRVVPTEGGGLLRRLRRLPGMTGGIAGFGETPGPLAFADDLLSAVEIRALWSRFGI